MRSLILTLVLATALPAAAQEIDLARLSHQLSTAGGDAQRPAKFSHLRVLNVLSSTLPRPSNRKPHWTLHLAALVTKPGEISGLDAWHEDHPVSQPDPPPEPRFELGFMPSLAVNVGVPNGVSAEGQLYLSFSRRGRWSFFTGLGYEVGPLADGPIVTVGWGGVKQPTLEVPTRGFHGAFLRYRRWEQRDHGEHHGLSAGWEHSLGSFGLALELGAARSDRNHWMPVARLGFKVGLPLLWGAED